MIAWIKLPKSRIEGTYRGKRVGCWMLYFSRSLHADMQVPLSTRGQSPLHFVNFASINKQIRFGCGVSPPRGEVRDVVDKMRSG